MTTCEEIRARLSEFVDGTLTADSSRAVDAHLTTCPACAGIAADLDRLRSAARRLGPIDPPDQVWLEIAGRVRLDPLQPSYPPARAGSRNAGIWQWIGLAAALVLVTLVVYQFQRRGATAIPSGESPKAASGNAAAVGSVETLEQELRQAEDHYDKAIAELEAITKKSDLVMDPEVARTLQKNLTTIDQAIVESRAALDMQPGSEPARDSLFEALRQKVDVLQDTVTLMNQMRNGDPDGAARAAAGIVRKSS